MREGWQVAIAAIAIWAIAVWATIPAASPAPAAPSEDRPATAANVLDRLPGTWEGKGELFGKPALFRMEWSRALGDRFLRLEFSSAFAPRAPEADPIPVLSATAFYRPGAPETSGTWLDSRGMVLPLAASVSESTLVVRWGAEGDAEQGRTAYAWTGPGTCRVTDEVLKDGKYEVFATADYWRVEPEGGSVSGGGASRPETRRSEAPAP